MISRGNLHIETPDYSGFCPIKTISLMTFISKIEALYLMQWCSYIGAFRAHALPNPHSALPLSSLNLAKDW